MNKAELVTALKRRVEVYPSVETAVILHFFVIYLESFPAEWTADGPVEPHIPQLLLGALEELRTSHQEPARTLRWQIEGITNQSFGNIVSLNTEYELVKHSRVMHLSSVIGEIMHAELEWRMQEIFHAERTVALQSFSRFLLNAMKHGLHTFLTTHGGMDAQGTLGKTMLSIRRLEAEQLIFEFKPAAPSEQEVSFMCSNQPPFGPGVVLLSCSTELRTVLNMLDEVSAEWPDEDKLSRVLHLTPSEKL